MASFLREKVSRNKIRFREDGFDLDLTYITPRIVAMGFPSEKVEGFYRNPISEVQRFYEKRHKEEYRLYNLCAERSYDPAKFHGRVITYPFEDHNAPPVQLIVDCCNDVHDWLSKDQNHVVGINCKAGKGRTGLIICCYLMHAGICKNASDAMLFYGTRRTKDGKGVTIASQQRYVHYYEQVLKMGRVPDPRMLKIKKLIVHTIPSFSGDPLCTVILKNQEVGSSPSVKISKGATSYEIPVDIPVIGDVKVQMSVKKGKSIQNTCHFWFNTGFIGADNKVSFKKSEIDVASKDKKNAHFKPEFSIDVEFEEIPVDTSAMAAGISSPRREGVEDEKDGKKSKKDKKDKKGKTKVKEVESDEESEEKPKKDKKSKDTKEVATPTKEPKTPKESKEGKKEKSSEAKSPEPAPKAEPAFAPPSGEAPAEDFHQKRKRRQSFYEVDEELENNEDLSDSAIEEIEMEEYFEPEEVDEDEEGRDSPKSEKKSEDGEDASKKKTDPESSDSSSPASPSDKAASKSIAINSSTPSSRRGNSSPAGSPASAPKSPIAEETSKESKKDKKEKKDKETSSNGGDTPSKKKKSDKKSDN